MFNVIRGRVLGGTTQVDEELAVYWVNTWNKGTLVRQKEEAIISNGSLNIDSFFSHSFLVVEEKVRNARHSGVYNRWDDTTRAAALLAIIASFTVYLGSAQRYIPGSTYRYEYTVVTRVIR